MQRRRLISAASSVLQYVRGGDTMACALQAALPQAVLRGAGAEPSAPCGNRPRGFLMRGHTPSRFSSVALQSGGAAELHPPQRTDTKRPAVLKFLDASGGETLVGAGDAAGPVAVVHSAASLETTLAEVWVVETREQAEQAVRVLRHFRPVNQGVAYHAIDTEARCHSYRAFGCPQRPSHRPVPLAGVGYRPVRRDTGRARQDCVFLCVLRPRRGLHRRRHQEVPLGGRPEGWAGCTGCVQAVFGGRVHPEGARVLSAVSALALTQCLAGLAQLLVRQAHLRERWHQSRWICMRHNAHGPLVGLVPCPQRLLP